MFQNNSPIFQILCNFNRILNNNSLPPSIVCTGNSKIRENLKISKEDEEDREFVERSPSSTYKWISLSALVLHAANLHCISTRPFNLLTLAHKQMDIQGWEMPAEKMYMALVLSTFAFKYFFTEFKLETNQTTMKAKVVEAVCETKDTPLVKLADEDIVALMMKKKVGEK